MQRNLLNIKEDRRLLPLRFPHIFPSFMSAKPLTFLSHSSFLSPYHCHTLIFCFNFFSKYLKAIVVMEKNGIYSNHDVLSCKFLRQV